MLAKVSMARIISAAPIPLRPVGIVVGHFRGGRKALSHLRVAVCRAPATKITVRNNAAPATSGASLSKGVMYLTARQGSRRHTASSAPRSRSPGQAEGMTMTDARILEPGIIGPIASVPASPARRPPPEADNVARKHILLVDDDEAFRADLSALLADSQFRVTEAASI